MSLSEFAKEITWRIKRDPDRSENIKSWKDVKERVSRLNQETASLNITKWELNEVEEMIWKEWNLRLKYLLQNALDVDLWLCDWFRTFYSKENHKYHSICMYTISKCRTRCAWVLNSCDQWFFNEDWEKSSDPEIVRKKIKFDKL